MPPSVFLLVICCLVKAVVSQNPRIILWTRILFSLFICALLDSSRYLFFLPRFYSLYRLFLTHIRTHMCIHKHRLNLCLSCFLLKSRLTSFLASPVVTAHIKHLLNVEDEKLNMNSQTIKKDVEILSKSIRLFHSRVCVCMRLDRYQIATAIYY